LPLQRKRKEYSKDNMKKSIFLVILSALLLILSFFKFNLGFLTWIALIPLLCALKDCSLKKSFVLGLLFGFVFCWGIIYWLHFTLYRHAALILWASIVSVILVAIYFSFFFAFFTLSLNYIRQRTNLSLIISAPMLWTSLELIRSLGSLGMPWVLLGGSQWRYPAIIQISTITGVYGVSFLIVMVNATIATVISSQWSVVRGKIKENFILISVVFILLLLSFSYGLVVLKEPSIKDRTSTIQVSIIQPNIDQEQKWDMRYKTTVMDTLVRLTKEVRRDAPDLIVWPETCIPGYLESEPEFYSPIKELIQKSKSYFIIGSMSKKGKEKHNTAFFLSPEGKILDYYHKIHPVPFAERFPKQDYFSSFSWYKEMVRILGEEGYEPINLGNKYVVFNVLYTKIGVPVCFEMIFPDLIRRFVKNGAEIIVNISDDAWFDQMTVPYWHHFSASVFRAIENRVNIVRATNTGISGFIDPYGRIRKTTNIWTEAHLTNEVPLEKTTTLYTKYGNLFAYFCLILSLYFLVSAYWKGG